jgi:hypothetical protein
MISTVLNQELQPKSKSALLERKDPNAKTDHLSDEPAYAILANRIAIKHNLIRTVAIIEAVSPGNKDAPESVRSFVGSMVNFIRQGVHVLLIDLFPPSPHASQGIHKLIWDEIHGKRPFVFPTGQDRLLVSYQVGEDCNAFVDPIGLNDELPKMPLFFMKDRYVEVPQQEAYDMAWDRCPELVKKVVLTGELPEQFDDEVD